MKIINELKRTLLEVLLGIVTVSIIIGVLSGMAYIIGLLGNKILYILIGIAVICVFGMIGKEVLETIDYHKKCKAEIEAFKEKYKDK